MNPNFHNTGKVKIGCLYQPPPRVVEMSATEIRLQRALLAPPLSSGESLWHRLGRWLYCMFS